VEGSQNNAHESTGQGTFRFCPSEQSDGMYQIMASASIKLLSSGLNDKQSTTNIKLKQTDDENVYQANDEKTTISSSFRISKAWVIHMIQS
jgi:hypothetical protein